eukprot:TRINITY_DN936_c0_g1_i1.p1 TRINITY_DN936_c0_g1~~TRINITY_DN936_c0_g1_i1.p1  ORF type:complete len:798 (+),score=150.67 TRINITY_DN936_c0_g1_i1:1333-3726(+)
MVDLRNTVSRMRFSLSSRVDSRNHQQQHPQPPQPSTTPSTQPSAQPSTPTVIHSFATQHSTAASSPSHIPTTSVPSIDAASTGSSMSPVPGAFYIPNAIAQRASINLPPADGAALRRQLAFDALALVRALPCHAHGWIFVKRDVSPLSALFRSQWLPFWAELRGGMLLFYDPSTDYMHATARHIKLVFTATNCIIDLKNSAYYSQLKLRRSDAQSLVMRVTTAQEAQQWVVALQTHTFQYTTVRLADFDWITAIGKGASGKVFLVRDNRTNARLALKVIDKSRVFRTQLTFQHIINERLVLESCSGCPFIIQLRYAFQTDSHLYFATDFYDGGDVFSLLQNHRGRLQERYARGIIAEIVLALSWLHQRNIVYRDLKPENVVLDGNGHVRLADFGLAKVLNSEQDYLTQTICGTTAYAAPEMLRSRPYNFALDLWCLGVFIYHILCGRTPFDFKGRSMEEMADMQRTKQIRFSSSLSIEAVSLIKGLLQLEPSRRCSLEDVKKHPFFRGVDWVRVARKESHEHGVCKLVGSKEKNRKVEHLAEVRTQQLGMENALSAQFGRVSAQEISSMTLDRYLLRNINADEWRHVSFSDDDDRSATAEFPAIIHKKGSEVETWAIAGWAWTCSEASGRAAFGQKGRQNVVAVSGGAEEVTANGGGHGVSARARVATAYGARFGHARSVLSHNRRTAEAGGVDAMTGGGAEQQNATARRRSAEAAAREGGGAAGATARVGGRGRRALGRIGSTLKEARERVSVDQLGWSRKSVERRRFGAWRAGGGGGGAGGNQLDGGGGGATGVA